MQRISEIMTTHVQTVSPQDTVRRAAQMMDELNVGALPVCDGERLVGMVTDRDITVRAVSAGIAPDDAVVDGVMSTDVRWCFEDQALDEVIRQMGDTQIRRIPVVSHDEAHRLVGIVSLGDLVTKSEGRSASAKMQDMVKKISSPSEPDRSPQHTSAAIREEGDRITASNTGTAAGLAGSDVLAERMNPEVEVSSTADPSEMVEVTPENLVNRNAPDSRTLTEKRASNTSGSHPEAVRVMRRTASDQDTSTGEFRTVEDVDVSGASGGTSGAADSAGTAIGPAP